MADARPDFIPLQLKTLYKFLNSNFKYVVLNNGRNYFRKSKIRSICNLMSVDCYEIPTKFRNHSDPCLACAIPLQWAFDTYMIHDKFPIILDSDIFLIDSLDINLYMSKFDLAAVSQSRGLVEYLWNGIIFMKKMKNKNNFNLMPGIVEGQNTDVGGNTYYWLKDNKGSIRWIKHTAAICSEHGNLMELPPSIRSKYRDEYHFEIYDKKFLHYSRGSNWDKNYASYHKDKTNLLKSFITLKLDGDLS